MRPTAALAAESRVVGNAVPERTSRSRPNPISPTDSNNDLLTATSVAACAGAGAVFFAASPQVNPCAAFSARIVVRPRPSIAITGPFELAATAVSRETPPAQHHKGGPAGLGYALCSQSRNAFTSSFEAEVGQAGRHGSPRRTTFAAAAHTRQRKGTSPPTRSANPARRAPRFAP